MFSICLLFSLPLTAISCCFFLTGGGVSLEVVRLVSMSDAAGWWFVKYST